MLQNAEDMQSSSGQGWIGWGLTMYDWIDLIIEDPSVNWGGVDWRLKTPWLRVELRIEVDCFNYQLQSFLPHKQFRCLRRRLFSGDVWHKNKNKKITQTRMYGFPLQPLTSHTNNSKKKKLSICKLGTSPTNKRHYWTWHPQFFFVAWKMFFFHKRRKKKSCIFARTP